MKKFLYPLLGIFCTNYCLSAKADQINLALDVADPIHKIVTNTLKEFNLSEYTVYEPKSYHITLAEKPTAELNIKKYEEAKEYLKENLKNISFTILGLDLVGNGQYIALKVQLNDNNISPLFKGDCVHISLLKENLVKQNIGDLISYKSNGQTIEITNSMDKLFGILKKKEAEFIFEDFKEVTSKKIKPKKNDLHEVQVSKKVESKETKPKNDGFKPRRKNRKPKKPKSNEINFNKSNFKERSIKFHHYYENKNSYKN